MLAHLKERKSESGFTLIELLVVMIIIAILMAVAVPTFLAQKNNAQKTKATANIKQIVNAIESCAVNNTDGTYASPTLTDCTDPAELVQFEKGLTSLGTIGTAGATAVGTYSVEAIGTQGYAVKGVIQDGDFSVQFAELHSEDGTLMKLCSASSGGTASNIANTATTGTGSSDSRTCTNGKWG